MHACLVRKIEIAYKILKTGSVIAVKEHIFIFYYAHILSNQWIFQFVKRYLILLIAFNCVLVWYDFKSTCLWQKQRIFL